MEHETGVTRLALTDDDRKVRDWFAQTTMELGCKLSIDEMGNMLAVRPGKKNGPPTCAGSHLDTQPTGGRYVSESNSTRDRF
jgi:acetylornithine deacetylase/succinyl-diaminopimelate desuccinylase-like protein